ncbi:MAG: aminopeptidase [Oscillibacter sp.]|nr:aminopeptidase [Oscillibacter sp.]
MSEEVKELKKKLLAGEKNGYDTISAEDTAAMEDYCAAYKIFLNHGKTERECAAEAVRLAEEKGFKPYHRSMKAHPGDKVYVCNRGKGVMLAVIGTESLSAGAQIAAAHIDSPRLDLKPNPLYEEGEMAYFKTHYYGGLRKYQWVTIPLELHGVIALRNGTTVTVALGVEEGESKFVITDLLPHLGSEQSKKPLSEAIPGESLNILLGSHPMGESDDTDRTRLQIMKLLNEKYGITEDDFTSAELEAVPTGKSVDIGLDRSLIGAYGHDDRVCGYAALAAILELSHPAKTAVCMLADKEEIGSMGVTGMQSAAFDTFMHDLCQSQGVLLRECYENSFCLSADVTAAYDPNFADVFEKKNSARVNHGMGLCKYTGARGKSGASDACAETVAYVRRLLDESGVIWQISELGKVDAGGGGTVAMYMANRNIATLDAGVPVLSMHAPFEVVSKLDCYMTYKGCKAVFEAE